MPKDGTIFFKFSQEMFGQREQGTRSHSWIVQTTSHPTPKEKRFSEFKPEAEVAEGLFSQMA